MPEEYGQIHLISCINSETKQLNVLKFRVGISEYKFVVFQYFSREARLDLL